VYPIHFNFVVAAVHGELAQAQQLQSSRVAEGIAFKTKSLDSAGLSCLGVLKYTASNNINPDALIGALC
jgi:hypothetical protein